MMSKRRLLILSCMCIFSASFAQMPYFYAFGNQDQSGGELIRSLSDGSAIVTGVTFAGINGGKDVLAMRFDSSGTLLWEYQYGTAQDDYYMDADVTPDEHLLMLVNSYATLSTCVLKLDANGDTTWTKRFYDGVPVVGHSITATRDSGFAILAANDSGFPPGTNNCKIIRCDANGNVLWSRTYVMWVSSTQLVECDNGDLVAIATDDMAQTVMLRVDSSGNVLWSTIWPSGYGDVATDIAAVGNDVVVVGNYFNLPSGQSAGYIRRIAQNGSLVWEEWFSDSSGYSSFASIVVRDSLLVIGGMRQGLTTGHEIYLVTDINGVIVSQGGMDLPTIGSLGSMDITNTGQILMTGWVRNGFASGWGYLSVVRVDPATQTVCGLTQVNLVAVADTCPVTFQSTFSSSSGMDAHWSCTRGSGLLMVDGCTVGIPEVQAAELNVSPNPATSDVTIDLPYQHADRITLVDVSGRLVAVHVNVSAERYTIDLSSCAPGVYFVTVYDRDVCSVARVVKQ